MEVGQGSLMSLDVIVQERYGKALFANREDTYILRRLSPPRCLWKQQIRSKLLHVSMRAGLGLNRHATEGFPPMYQQQEI